MNGAAPSGAPTPFIISWNLTERCNLRCAHCYMDSSTLSDGPDRTTTADAISIIDSLASLNPSAMLVLTGGEPLARADIFDIAGYASKKGFMTVLGTNGSLLDEEACRKLKEAGVKGAGVSLDSAGPEAHDSFRGVAGSWEAALRGIRLLKRHGIEVQVQFSLGRFNFHELGDMARLCVMEGAVALNVFFLVCTGRGQKMTDLTAAEYEEALKTVAGLEGEHAGRLMVRARCAPHYSRVALGVNPGSTAMSGCLAGRSYFRITPSGGVTACPYIPDAVGSLKEMGASEIWRSSAFDAFRRPSYSGKCSRCEYLESCGGCRARALASTGGVMGEDPWCGYEPGVGDARPAKMTAPEWDDAAEERLKRVPPFLRAMVKGAMERYAAARGSGRVTVEMMEDVRRRVPFR